MGRSFQYSYVIRYISQRLQINTLHDNIDNIVCADTEIVHKWIFIPKLAASAQYSPFQSVAAHGGAGHQCLCLIVPSLLLSTVTGNWNGLSRLRTSQQRTASHFTTHSGGGGELLECTWHNTIQLSKLRINASFNSQFVHPQPHSSPVASVGMVCCSRPRVPARTWLISCRIAAPEPGPGRDTAARISIK